MVMVIERLWFHMVSRAIVLIVDRMEGNMSHVAIPLFDFHSLMVKAMIYGR